MAKCSYWLSLGDTISAIRLSPGRSFGAESVIVTKEIVQISRVCPGGPMAPVSNPDKDMDNPDTGEWS